MLCSSTNGKQINKVIKNHSKHPWVQWILDTEVKQAGKAVTNRTLAKLGKKSIQQILHLLLSVRNGRQNSRK